MIEPNFWKIVLGLIFPMAPMPPPVPGVTVPRPVWDRPNPMDDPRMLIDPVVPVDPVYHERYLRSRLSEELEKPVPQPALIHEYRHQLDNQHNRNIRYNPHAR